jgi:hypothetical protein
MGKGQPDEGVIKLAAVFDRPGAGFDGQPDTASCIGMCRHFET